MFGFETWCRRELLALDVWLMCRSCVAVIFSSSVGSGMCWFAVVHYWFACSGWGFLVEEQAFERVSFFCGGYLCV